MTSTLQEPKSYRAIMVSSTFTDLEKHRQKVIDAINGSGYKPNVMEHEGARADADVIESSLELVRDSAAYVGVISRKYGQTPFCRDRNPKRLSITELEFNEATRLGRPIVLFLMSEKHMLTEADIERDPKKIKKLEAFRKRAKRMRKRGEVERVYAQFESLEDFSSQAAKAISRLDKYLSSKHSGAAEESTDAPEIDAAVPRPPALAALPTYLGSHQFAGRASELRTLNDWCKPADPNPMFLYEAMGGSGKSMLTWEWLTKHAVGARGNWAGRFWYSFYAKGALMSGFCRQALAYMTATGVEHFAKLRTPELADRLVAELEKRPWLVVLDGLERILVAYHRDDAAQIRDDEVDAATDQVGSRDPCSAIRPDDDDLLRRLAAVARSKILVSSRLTPLALINRSRAPVPGVRRETLHGLRPADAEAMIRACGVFGDSKAIQEYLQSNCDCHPLVVGALAGLINDYPPDRGNFDRWVEDPTHGGAFNLGELKLVRRRNHILYAAIEALTAEGRQLLQILALLQTGADFETLKDLNPHLPPRPAGVEGPEDQMQHFYWSLGNKEQRTQEKARYDEILAERDTHLDAVARWKNDPVVQAAPGKLGETLRDLEKRGLMQYEPNGKKYDLHPVIRGVVAGRMGEDEMQRLGQKVVDYLASRPHAPWEQAETIEDLAPGLQVVRVLLRMRRYHEAAKAYRGDLARALLFNLDAKAEVQALLRPFFPNGWGGEPVELPDDYLSYILNDAGLALESEQAWKVLERKLALNLRNARSKDTVTALENLAINSHNANRLAEARRLSSLALELSEAINDNEEIFAARYFLYMFAVDCGDSTEADKLWRSLEAMGRDWSRAAYRPGALEVWRAIDLFYRGELTEKVLANAERVATDGRNRVGTAFLHELRGAWQLNRGMTQEALASLAEGVRMARESGDQAPRREALFALARLRVGEVFDARAQAERLSNVSEGRAALAVANLWRELGERKRAIEEAQRAYRWALAEGTPHVHKYYVDRTRTFLSDLGVPLPDVPRYDPTRAKRYPWERDVRDFIDGQRRRHVASNTRRKRDALNPVKVKRAVKRLPSRRSKKK